MELMEAIHTRRTVRAFLSSAVDRPTVEILIDAAIQAPSAMDLQPWAFAVVEGARTLERYSTQAKAHLLSVLDSSSPLFKYRDRLSDASFNMFYGAPVLVVVSATSGDGQFTEDCCLAAQNLMLAAHDRGLGTCWVGFAQPWLNLPMTKVALGIPEGYAPVAPIIVGAPQAVPRPVARRKPKIIWCQTPS
jgi:nitroreductase